jgi:hypothetical protein
MTAFYNLIAAIKEAPPYSTNGFFEVKYLSHFAPPSPVRVGFHRRVFDQLKSK